MKFHGLFLALISNTTKSGCLVARTSIVSGSEYLIPLSIKLENLTYFSSVTADKRLGG
jgi:hypothetical protein